LQASCSEYGGAWQINYAHRVRRCSSGCPFGQGRTLAGAARGEKSGKRPRSRRSRPNTPTFVGGKRGHSSARIAAISPGTTAIFPPSRPKGGCRGPSTRKGRTRPHSGVLWEAHECRQERDDARTNSRVAGTSASAFGQPSSENPVAKPLSGRYKRSKPLAIPAGKSMITGAGGRKIFPRARARPAAAAEKSALHPKQDPRRVFPFRRPRGGTRRSTAGHGAWRTIPSTPRPTPRRPEGKFAGGRQGRLAHLLTARDGGLEAGAARPREGQGWTIPAAPPGAGPSSRVDHPGRADTPPRQPHHVESVSGVAFACGTRSHLHSSCSPVGWRRFGDERKEGKPPDRVGTPSAIASFGLLELGPQRLFREQWREGVINWRSPKDSGARERGNPFLTGFPPTGEILLAARVER